MKAQATIEFMAVFSISVVVLIFLFLMVYDQMTDVGVQKEKAEVQKTVADLAEAIRDVYTQGEGASRSVRVILPSTYDAVSSGIFNNSLVIKVRENYYVENFEFPVTGTLPQSSGSFSLVLVSRGGSISVGSALFRLNPALISTVIPPNATQVKHFTVSNLVNETITVDGTLQWAHSGVGASTSSLDFDLSALEEREITLTFSANDTSGGYSGTIGFSANSSSLNDTQSLKLYAEIPAVTSDMMVYPDVWAATVSSGQNTTKEFVICSTGDTVLTGVTFTPG